MSASMRPTRWPARASATARFAETVDFPTPPLPDEMATTFPRCGSSTGVGGGGTAPDAARGAPCPALTRPCAALASATLTRTAVTPSIPCTAVRPSRASEPRSARPRRNVEVTVPAEQSADLLTGRGVGWAAGREGRHLAAIVRRNRVDLRPLPGRERDALEQHLHAPPPLRSGACVLGRGARRREHEQGGCGQCQHRVRSHRSSAANSSSIHTRELLT